MSEPVTPRFACGCVDVHTHIVPERFPKYVGRQADARWPTMAAAKPCHQHVMLDGKIYRTVSHQTWDTGVRLQDMQATGITRQVLSPMPELLSYWLDADDGVAMCRFLNETIAQMVSAAPDRFSGLGAVPLQDVDRAVVELERAVRDFGLAGVEIGSNINGTPIGDARLRPFFEAAERLGAAVFVHPLRPAGLDRVVGPPIYEQAVAFPGEIGLAAISMITGGTMLACPGLRIAFSHGAGSLQVQAPRLQQAWEKVPAIGEAIKEAPRETVRRMFYDDLLYDATAIEALVRLAGPTQVMIGTDYPFTIMDQDPVGRIASLGLDEAVRDALRGGNAQRWLGLPNAA
jgi:aminocarboxymuconate-semialdehyde decarboxylase